MRKLLVILLFIIVAHAQELEEILPEAVNTGGDGIKSISDGNQLSAVIIEAIKELTTRLQALENA